MHILPREKHDTNRDYAFKNIKANIIDLSLEPGSMVSENELAAELGLSRTPIREALIELSKVGLVEIYPQRGSAIAQIDYDMVEEAQFMRNVLECSVAELACQVIQEEDIRVLLDNVMQQEHYLNTGMTEKILLLDNAFHRLLFRIVHKEQMWSIMNSFTAHFDRVHRMAVATVKDSKIVADHRAIFDAICAHDPDTAKKVMNKHLLRFRVEKELLMQNYPKEYFKN